MAITKLNGTKPPSCSFCVKRLVFSCPSTEISPQRGVRLAVMANVAPSESPSHEISPAALSTVSPRITIDKASILTYPIIVERPSVPSPLLQHQLMLSRQDVATVDALTRSESSIVSDFAEARTTLVCAREVEEDLSHLWAILPPRTPGREALLNLYRDVDLQTFDSPDDTEHVGSTNPSETFSSGSPSY